MLGNKATLQLHLNLTLTAEHSTKKRKKTFPNKTAKTGRSLGIASQVYVSGQCMSKAPLKSRLHDSVSSDH